MKRTGIGIAAAALLAACASAAIDDRDFGLGKGSVFDSATPAAYTLDAGRAAPRALATPPVITHPIDTYPPIGTAANPCLACHDRPAAAAAAKGAPAAVPPDHVAAATAGKATVSGAYWNCLLCHAPQAEVPALVGNRAN